MLNTARLVKSNKTVSTKDQAFDVVNDLNVIRDFFDAIDAMVIVCDERGQIIYCNKRFIEITGYQFDEIKEAMMWDFVDPERSNEVKEVFITKQNRQFPFTYEGHWKLKDNKQLSVNWTGVGIHGKNKKIKYVVGTGQVVEQSSDEEKWNFIDNTPLCVKVFDKQGKLIFVNRGGRKEHFLKETDNILQWNWLDTVKEEYRVLVEEKLHRALQGEDGVCELEHTPEGSSNEWCSLTFSSVKDAKTSSVQSVLVFSTDITFLKKLGLVSKKNEEMSRALLDAAPLCIKWFDKEGNIISVNKVGREEHYLVDKSEEEIKQWNFIECFDTAYQDKVKQKMDLAKQGVSSTFEVRHAPGTSCNEWCLSTITSVKNADGNVDYILFLSRDITEVKKREQLYQDNIQKMRRTKEALFNILDDVKESEKNLQKERDRSGAILSSMGEGLLVLDEQLNVLLINQRAGVLLRKTLDEVIGKKLEEVFVVSQVNKSFDLTSIVRHVVDKRDIARYGLEYKLFCHVENATDFPVELLTSPFSGDGLSGSIIIFNDVTEEQKLDEAKSSFISVASHQLRTPLTSIRWFAEMLLEGDGGTITDDQRHFVERIYQGVDRMIKLIGLLLQMARVEAGRIKIQSTPVDLRTLAEEVVASLKSSLDQAQQSVTIEALPKDGFPAIPLDKEVVWQVIMNLLTNAIRYSPPHATIAVSVTKDDNFAILTVKDQGIGIPKAQQADIFRKFFRASNAFKLVPEGSGLGLALVKSLVEDWGGKVWFETEENKGTDFHVSIPLKGVASREGEVGLVV